MTGLTGKHFLTALDITRADLEDLFSIADTLQSIAEGKRRTNILNGCVMGSLFFEPSTRTRLSFDSAFMRLGGSVSHTAGEDITSVSKGESYSDTGRVVSGYYDIIVLRHPNPEAFREFVSASKVPVINAGSGAEEHPTQALLDAYTARNELAKHGKDIGGSHIAFTGDLKYGRTVHSLIKLLSLYQGLTFYLISPKGLELPESITAIAKAAGHKIIYCTSMKEGIQNADVIYATRLQRERFSREEFLGIYPEFAIDFNLVDVHAKANVVIMHPLPRDSRPGSHDLSVTLNKDPRLAIFSQTDNGVVVRMALFSTILGFDNSIKASLHNSTWFKPSDL